MSLLVLTSEIVFAQSSIDEVHITPRGKPVALAAANYDSAFGGASLIRTSVNLVLVPVSITDERNQPVIGLDQDNFQLFENKKPQAIKNFSNEDTPVSIGILVDTSGSMSYKLQRAREAVQQFCDAANPQDEFFLITFADTPELVSDFTTNTQQIASDLLTTRSRGQTSLLDAIYMGVKKMREAHYARKALLILSDGGDNHSRYNERDVKSAIRESDISIYAVGTYDRWVNTTEELMGPELLSTIADMTGGVSFTLNSPNDMPGVTRNIGTRLRHQYVLAYQPQSAPHDGKWHKISVKLRLPKHFPFMHVEARPGYYASGGE
ncbi:MAG TPA: VWA domain-containing protein [Candidatus Solibacter sp.]|nr:VWA domain-containing protein [Candidatus Solibacter sp.]